MRIIKLTHEEIELIKLAAQFVYDSQMKIVNDNRKVLSKEAADKMIEQADKFFDIQDVFKGERDV